MGGNDGAGCIMAIFLLALLAWVPLHFSGKSILYGRTTEQSAVTNSFGMKTAIVTCHYFNSTGTEDRAKLFEFSGNEDGYYCPRLKDVGQ